MCVYKVKCDSLNNEWNSIICNNMNEQMSVMLNETGQAQDCHKIFLVYGLLKAYLMDVESQMLLIRSYSDNRSRSLGQDQVHNYSEKRSLGEGLVKGLTITVQEECSRQRSDYS